MRRTISITHEVDELIENLADERGLTVSSLIAKLALEELENPRIASKTFPIPLLGTVPAGTLLQCGFEGSAEQVDCPISMLPMRVRKSAYALRVRGDSMESKNHSLSIPDGSTIVVVRREPLIGEIVIGLVDGTGSTIKMLAEERGKKVLRALNPRYRDIVPFARLECQGVFHAIIP